MTLTFNCIITLVVCLAVSCHPKKDTIKVAVASNFLKPCKALVSEFNKNNDSKVEIISASTGKIFSLIQNGAKYDIFLAADLERPKAIAEKRTQGHFTYAYGRLALWNSSKQPILNSLHTDFQKIAIANPKLAPYGKAAQEILETKKLWDKLKDKIIYGENVNQVFIFSKTEPTNASFIPLNTAKSSKGFYLEFPKELHNPIAQAAIRLTESKGSKDFEAFLKSSKAKSIIKSFDYEVNND